MGEINPQVAAKRPLLCEKDFPYTPARNPAVLACAPAPGPAVLVNLAPGPGGSFGLIVAPVQVLGDATNRKMRRAVRGWIRPAGGDVAAFLENYSLHGGTHHSALVLGARAEAICAFAEFAGVRPHLI
jgi:L-arabinose isomerase